MRSPPRHKQPTTPDPPAPTGYQLKLDTVPGRLIGAGDPRRVALVSQRGIIAVIPEPSDQRGHRARRGSRGGRTVSYDIEDCKACNVVERSFNDDKQWRGIATRYNKLALTYRGGAVLRAITL